MKRIIPKRFRGAEIEHLDPKQFGAVTEYAKDIDTNFAKGVGVLLSGPNGVGKTYAMAALTKSIEIYYVNKQRPFDYEFVSAPQLFERLPVIATGGRRKDDSDSRRSSTWLETYSTVPMLVVNDLGKEFRQGGFKEQVIYTLGNVLRARSERMLVTHFTTNFPLTKKRGSDAVTLFEEYGESIRSLLCETVVFVEVTGKDRRSGKRD